MYRISIFIISCLFLTLVSCSDALNKSTSRIVSPMMPSSDICHVIEGSSNGESLE